MQRLKVAYFLTPITFGGSERVSLNFLKAVDRSKFDVHPILFVRPWKEEPYFASQLRGEGYTFSVISVGSSLKSGLAQLILNFASIFNKLRKGAFHLVHTHGYRADLLCIPACRLLGIPHVTTCHGFVSGDRKLEFYNRLDRAALRLSDRVISVSENIKASLLQAGISQGKIKLLPNAVFVNNDAGKWEMKRQIARKLLAAKDSEPVIGFAGRLSEEKGLKYLIWAFAEIIKKRPDCKIILLGEGPLRLELEKLCSSIGLSDRVFFLGFCEKLIDMIVGMDVFVLPSLTEGTPMALLEAMSAGIPCVASEVGQIPKIIRSGENGILVRPSDSQGITEAIIRIVGDKDLSRQLSINGIRTVEDNYSIGPWIRKIEDIYRELLKV